MGLRAVITRNATGAEYLRMVTDLLHGIRLASAEGGLWEAADMQWAWRKDQHPDPSMATFWIDDSDSVVAGAVVTDWGRVVNCDLLLLPVMGDQLPTMWQTLMDAVAGIYDREIETSLDDADAAGIRLAADAGFVVDGPTAVSCWLDADNRPPVTDIAAGYRLRSRADATDTPHHMIKRNGDDVAARLLECSLYDPALDLFVEAADGSVAAYGLFWPDPVTGVGLVEPMRTEDDHQGRGLARHILTAGVERLAHAGCTRMKITYMDDNPVSGHVYVSSGFEPRSFARPYRRPR